MATNEDLGAQLKMQQDINKALQQRAGLLSKNTKEISTQVQLAAELCNAMECKDLEGMNDRLGEIQQSLSQVAEEADKAVQEGIQDAISQSVSDAIQQSVGEAMSAGLVAAIEEATGEAIDDALEQELANAIDAEIARAVEMGIEEAQSPSHSHS